MQEEFASTQRTRASRSPPFETEETHDGLLDVSENGVKSALVLRIRNFGWMDGRGWDQEY